MTPEFLQGAATVTFPHHLLGPSSPYDLVFLTPGVWLPVGLWITLSSAVPRAASESERAPPPPPTQNVAEQRHGRLEVS